MVLYKIFLLFPIFWLYLLFLFRRWFVVLLFLLIIFFSETFHVLNVLYYLLYIFPGVKLEFWTPTEFRTFAEMWKIKSYLIPKAVNPFSHWENISQNFCQSSLSVTLLATNQFLFSTETRKYLQKLLKYFTVNRQEVFSSSAMPKNYLPATVPLNSP